jgi:hypothetical protein
MRLLVKARRKPAEGQLTMFGPSGQPTEQAKQKPKPQPKPKAQAAWQPIPGGKYGGQRRRKSLRTAWSGWLDNLMAGPQLTVPAGRS